MSKVHLNLARYLYADIDSKLELVPVTELLKFREFNRLIEGKYSKQESFDNIKKLEDVFKTEGITSPLIIEYSVEDNAVLLIEGNHRLNVALELGVRYLPARVVRRNSSFPNIQKAKSFKVSGFEPNQYGYVPADLKPSQVGIQGTKSILTGSESVYDENISKKLFGGVIDGNTELFNTAISYNDNGIGNEQIFYETGYFIGLDGKWRSEIDDYSYFFKFSDEKLLSYYKENKPILLNKLINHDDFFNIFPKAEKIFVYLHNIYDYDFVKKHNIKGINAIGEFVYNVAHSDKFNFYKIDLYVDFEYIKENGKQREKYPSESSAELVILHELQHIIQSQRNFRKGSSYSDRVEQLHGRLEEIRTELSKNENLISTDFPNQYIELENKYNYFLNNIHLLAFEEYQKDPAEIEARQAVIRFINRDKSFPKQLDGIINKFEDGGGITNSNGLLAPNGKSSNLTPEQYKLVRSDAFISWFGDWINSPETASKVVDENGEPLVVYHGSNNKFFIFNPDLIGYSSGAKRTRRGVYFSSKKEVAKTFIKKHYWKANFYQGNEIIYEVFLNLRNPNIIDGEGKNIIWLDRDIRDIEWNEVRFKDNSEKGFIIRNTIDTIGDLIEYSDIYIVYNPSDVKLADGTNTTFDSNNPDIRFKNGGEVLLAPNGKPSNLTPEQYKLVRSDAFISWFGNWENINFLDNLLSSERVIIKRLNNDDIHLFKTHSDRNSHIKKICSENKTQVKSSIGNIKITTKGLEHSLRHSVDNIVLQSINFIDDLFSNAIGYGEYPYIPKSENDNNKDFLHFKYLFCIVEFESKYYFFRASVPYSKANRSYILRDYNFEEIKSPLEQIAVRGQKPNLTIDSNGQYKDNRLNSLLQTYSKNVSKMLDDNGEPLVCYHGTNREFTVFRSDVGSSHDLGFYGRGFYFTFNPESNWMKFAKGEAAYYGSLVKDYFIKIINPFDFSELSEYKGVKINYLGTESIVFLSNIAIKYPELSDKIKVQQVKWNKETQENDVNYVPISVLPELIEKYSKMLNTFETEDNFGEKNKISGYVKSELVDYDYTSTGGTKGSYTSIDTLGRYDKKIKKEELEILLVVDAIEKYDRIEAKYQPEGYMTRYPEITDLIKKEHDGIIQSKFGDEVVVFEPTQIKLADGTNVTFDGNNPDVRFKDGGGIDDKIISARKMQLRNKLSNILKTLDYKTVDIHSGKSKEDLFIQRVVDMIYNGYDFKSKLDIERIATKEFGFDDAKKVRELTEYAILFVGRDISKENDVKEAYDKLVSLYANQPYSTNRTVKSQELGQFSTPAPMAYLMGVYVGINKNQDNKIYFEPTAGNGMLSIAGNPEDFVVNELDFNRYNNLLKDNYKLVLNQDATKPFNFDYKFDGLLANPPFATTKIDKIVDNFKISGLENQIMINSLDLLKDDARGAFIVGGHTEFDSAGRIKSAKDKSFLSYLYSRYNVEDVINVSGMLYGRQGTTYPIRIILFNGRKSIPSGYYPLKNEKLNSFEPFSHRVINNFDELYERFKKTLLINQ